MIKTTVSFINNVYEYRRANMSSAIIDIQCTVGKNSKYMIKEMSIVDIETWSIGHWIFKHTRDTQDEKSLNVNRWLETHYHEIPLEYGDIQYDEICRILNSFNFKCIYIKGEQKKNIIKEFVQHTSIINLEEMSCPRLNQLCIEDTMPCCIYHMKLNHKQCTLHKVFTLRKWFINNC